MSGRDTPGQKGKKSIAMLSVSLRNDGLSVIPRSYHSRYQASLVEPPLFVQ